MPKRTTDQARRRERAEGEQPPAGMTRRQRRDWFDELNRRRALESATVADAFLVVNTAVDRPAVDLVEGPEAPERKRAWPVRMLARAWDARPLLAALALITGLLYVIIPTQINYYRNLGGLDPVIGGVHLHTYLTVPVVTEALAAYMGLLAGFTIHKNSGRYRMYLKWMWLFASVSASVNVKNGWSVGDSTHLTAFLLGGLSLAVPLVWHFYAGISLRVKHSGGMTISELAAISQAWTRHPRFSIRTARAVDLFPDLTRQEVWNMIVQNHREHLVQKWTTKPVPRAERRRRKLLDDAATIRAARELAGVEVVEDITSRWSRLKSAIRREPGLNVKLNPPVEPEHPVSSTVQVAERPGPAGEVPAETAAETTGELRRKQFMILAWHEHCGSHLPDDVRLVRPPHGTATRVGEQLGCTGSLVSRVFRECAAGKHDNPFLNVDQNLNKAGE